jgi:hypothetical protein
MDGGNLIFQKMAGEPNPDKKSDESNVRRKGSSDTNEQQDMGFNAYHKGEYEIDQSDEDLEVKKSKKKEDKKDDDKEHRDMETWRPGVWSIKHEDNGHRDDEIESGSELGVGEADENINKDLDRRHGHTFENGQPDTTNDSNTNGPADKLSEINKLLDKEWPKEALRDKYTTICNDLYEILVQLAGTSKSPETLQLGLEKVGILRAKYEQLLTTKKQKKKRALIPYPMTRGEVWHRFKGPEEEVHPWLTTAPHNMPSGDILYRTWDKSSQCQIVQVDFGLLSGGSHSNFATKEGRKHDLECHANWGCREKTPFISTTPSIQDIVGTWINSFRGRQKPPLTTVRITAVNINARLHSKWPIIKMLPELEHYNVDIPAKCSYANYVNEYLLPFRICQDEIIWTWHYTDVQNWLDKREWADIKLWETQVARPMYEEHERSRKAGETYEERQRKAVALMMKVMPTAVHTHWHAAMQGCLLG